MLLLDDISMKIYVLMDQDKMETYVDPTVINHL